MNSFFLSGSLPPNAEGSAEQSEAIGASVRTQVRIRQGISINAHRRGEFFLCEKILFYIKNFTIKLLTRNIYSDIMSSILSTRVKCIQAGMFYLRIRW